ncbi:MAG: hypothetical protein RBS34_04195 [Desulfofustis sp.]|nr:hypothetical protein [Desulfofustis sp.]
MPVTHLKNCFPTALLLVVSAVLLVLMVGCQTRGEKENRLLAEEVMAIHDEAMAKMTLIHELKLQLEELAQTNGNEEIEQGIIALQQAHQGMMTWMRAYRQPIKEELDKVQTRQYLLAEKEKIVRVQVAIEAAIDRAQQLLSRQ